MSRKSVFILSLLAAASFNAAACYTVFDRSDRVVYQGEDAPVDLTLPLHRALQARYPGGHMVFEQSARCEPIARAQSSPRRAAMTMASASNTAVMGASAAPNTAVMGAGPANGKVTRSAARAPAVAAASPMLTDRQTAMAMNVPYQVLSGNIVMIPAGAAGSVGMSTMNIVPSGITAAARANANGQATVITEMHNPPMTVVQNGAETIVASRY